MNLKQIFEALKKLINNKHVDQISHYNFGLNYMNTQGRLQILDFEFQNL